MAKIRTTRPLTMVDLLAAAASDPALKELHPRQLANMLEQLNAPPAPPPNATPSRPQRWQDKLIEHHIPAGSTVLDLGCGSGELLARLMAVKNVHGQGIELDPEQVYQCVERGVPVFQANLDLGLKGLLDQSFDYVILEETLQTLHRPIDVLQEMLRVGRHGIVSFPNFGYWRVRLSLALGGRMPVTEDLPYRWFDTPNIHLFTLQDFLDWVSAAGVRLVEAQVLSEGAVRGLQQGDNLYAEEVLVVVNRA